MKQNVLIEVSMNDNKSRCKAMKTAVGLSGVESAALKGNGKNQIEVVGDGFDAIELTRSLRKKVGFAQLLKVNPVGDKKEEPKKNEATPQPPLIYQYPAYGVPQYQYVYDYGAPYYEPSCTIM